jgi:hypothetical protein
MMHNNGFFGSWSENGADEMNDRLVFFFFFFFFFFFCGWNKEEDARTERIKTHIVNTSDLKDSS